jgi:2-polyprenyl-3-methyl-5-hydroxy-6-metoxy-1,4-benzoquinol methylase
MGEERFSAPRTTFRDPAGSVEVRDDSVSRSVKGVYAAELLSFLEGPLAAELVANGQLVGSEVVRHEGDLLLLRHPRVSFISYPWEWAPKQWLAAAELTLDLVTQLVKQGWILKDATPLNVLFEGMRPVFVDVASVEKLDVSRPIWLAYGQFVRTFLLPMLAHSQLGWPLQSVRLRRDGFEPEDLYEALPWSRRLSRGALTPVTLPILLSRMMGNKGGAKPGVGAGESVARKVTDPEITKSVLLRNISSLRSTMRRAMPRSRQSVWSEYVKTAGHYSAGDHDEKKRFVAETLERTRPAKVLDVGCNTGVYSKLAAEAGAEVISIDTDLQALDRLCSELKGSGAKILPLHVDLAYPPPALGWENAESRSFLERATGHFDMVMMLAVIHHLLLGAQVPMERIAALVSRLTTRHLIIEWVPPTDPKFIEVLRGREAIYTHITEQLFRQSFGEYFTVANETLLSNGRILFHMTRR